MMGTAVEFFATNRGAWSGAICSMSAQCICSVRALHVHCTPVANACTVCTLAVLTKFYEKFVEGKKSEYIDDDGNVIKVPGAQYDEMGVRKLYTGQEENALADEAAKKIAGA